jgi:hypothetical protein
MVWKWEYFPYGSATDFNRVPETYSFYCTETPDSFIHFAHFFRLKSVIFDKKGLSKFKSLCFSDFKLISKFKIVQAFSEKTASKPITEFMIHTAYTVVMQ